METRRSISSAAAIGKALFDCPSRKVIKKPKVNHVLFKTLSQIIVVMR